MKKALVTALAVMMIGSTVSPSLAANTQRGGLMGFIAGCCFGLRAGAAYNDGKEIHWREWCRLIPYVGIVFAVWDGIDGANGVTTADFAARYGAQYY